MPETLLTPSSIKLFGRLMNSLSYSDDTAEEKLGCNNFLQHQLSCVKYSTFHGSIREEIQGKDKRVLNRIVDITAVNDLIKGMVIEAPEGFFTTETSTTITHVEIAEDAAIVRPTPLKAGTNIEFKIVIAPKFARIYAFSFEGSIYQLPRPPLFLVHGWGKAVNVTGGNRWKPAGTRRGQWPGGGGVGRTDLDESGVIAREWEFAAPDSPDNLDLRYWEYEKGDFSLRLDIEAGQFEEILLMAALRAGAADRSGASLSGASLSGASLSGASLSGASLSGASLSGASLAGASLNRNGR